MADTSPGRLTRLVGVRDQMMADNLLVVAERGPALVSGHNGHLLREKSTMRMGGRPVEWWSAGAIVNAHLGEAHGFLATAPAGQCPIGPAAGSSLVSLLRLLPGSTRPEQTGSCS